jgi:zinc finger BED domain-containing protein 1 (E3 SUMO-protein ligase ZBED1)
VKRSFTSAHLHEAQRPTDIKKMFLGLQPFQTSSSEWMRRTDAITRWLAKDMKPIYTVSKASFVNMLQVFEPRYKLPHRKYFSQTAIPKLYNDTFDAVQLELQTAKSIWLTCDGWTSNGAFDPYWTVTSHFINEDFDLRCHSLETFYMPEDHDGPNLSENLLRVMEDWGIKEKVCGITTDNGSNIVRAARLLGMIRIPCFGHCLHLAVLSALNEPKIQKLLGKCRKITSTFSSSWKRQLKLTKKQTELNIPTRKLPRDCITRWGSMYKLLNRIDENKEAINAVVITDERTGDLEITFVDRVMLRECLTVLTPLHQLTDSLCGEKNVTVSSIIPTLDTLYSETMAESDSDTELVKNMKEQAKIKLRSKYDDDSVMRLLMMCTVLDPRYKFTFVSDAEEQQTLKHMLEREIINCLFAASSLGTLQPNNGNLGHTTASATANSSQNTDNEQSATTGLASFLSKNRKLQAIQTSALTRSPREELETYLKLPCISVDNSPLDWWHKESQKFPGVSRVARKFLAGQGTAVASERLWSNGGYIVNERRNKLKPSTVSQLMFLSKNLY